MNNAWKLIQSYIARVPHGAAIGYVALVLLFAFMALTSLTDVLDRRTSVADAADTLAQLEGRLPKRGGAGASAVTGSPVLEGPTVTVAGAALLQRVAEAITKAGGNILSSQVDLQGPQVKDGFISVTANCDIEQPALQQLSTISSWECHSSSSISWWCRRRRRPRPAGPRRRRRSRCTSSSPSPGNGRRRTIARSTLRRLTGALALASVPFVATARASARPAGHFGARRSRAGPAHQGRRARSRTA